MQVSAGLDRFQAAPKIIRPSLFASANSFSPEEGPHSVGLDEIVSNVGLPGLKSVVLCKSFATSDAPLHL